MLRLGSHGGDAVLWLRAVLTHQSVFSEAFVVALDVSWSFLS